MATGTLQTLANHSLTPPSCGHKHGKPRRSVSKTRRECHISSFNHPLEFQSPSVEQFVLALGQYVPSLQGHSFNQPPACGWEHRSPLRTSLEHVS